MRSLVFAALCLVALLLPCEAEAAAPEPPPFLIVLHPKNPNSRLSRKFVADALLKKVTRWPDGAVIRPVDQVPDAPVRRRVSQDVVKRSVSAVRIYWQQSVFAGRETPPPELSDDEEVLRYVLRHEGAIGYVSGAARTREAKVAAVE